MRYTPTLFTAALALALSACAAKPAVETAPPTETPATEPAPVDATLAPDPAPETEAEPPVCYLRLNFSHTEPELMVEGLRRLRKVLLTE